MFLKNLAGLFQCCWQVQSNNPLQRTVGQLRCPPAADLRRWALPMKPRTVLFGLLFVLLAGCSYALNIAVAWGPDGRPLFTISRALISADALGSVGADLNAFYVFSEVNGAWDYKHPIWSLQLPPGTSKTVENVLYGEVPAGFEEHSRPAPLMRGAKYQAAAFGPGCGGNVEFIVSQ